MERWLVAQQSYHAGMAPPFHAGARMTLQIPVSSSQQLHPPGGGLAVREGGRSFFRLSRDARDALLARLDEQHAQSGGRV